MLHRSSMLPWDKFTTALDKAGRLGLMSKLAAAADHRTAIAYFAGRSRAPPSTRAVRSETPRIPRPRSR